MNKQSEIVKRLTDRELLLNVYLTQLMILSISIGLSWLLFNDWLAVFQLIKWNVNHALIGLAGGLFVVILEIILIKVLPSDWFDDGGINDRIFKRISPIHIAILSLTVAFCEELLFRGVLQTSFGIVIASIIFAVIHFRYMHKLFLFTFTIILSFFLGGIYYYTNNLLPVIIAHFLIDFILGLLIRYRIL
ncbi:CPBP family intramembrane glutamic endopeptidase [Evansella halocellulosilytica]|uniref:CPBP family intramembrane glutamic endopeptidase n=1 Tax=Evansella halocellulosilytica TaxID=2011013 RepID=UPI00211BCDE1|nr:type II CAAX endopeptidase family protein [Evansella halocellulosilytica]